MGPKVDISHTFLSESERCPNNVSGRRDLWVFDFDSVSLRKKCASERKPAPSKQKGRPNWWGRLVASLRLRVHFPLGWCFAVTSPGYDSGNR
jgi:hypothetical protein